MPTLCNALRTPKFKGLVVILMHRWCLFVPTQTQMLLEDLLSSRRTMCVIFPKQKTRWLKEHCNNMNEIHHNIQEETYGNPYIWYLLLILIRNKGHFFFIFKTIHLTVYVITNRLILPEYKQTDADAT